MLSDRKGFLAIGGILVIALLVSFLAVAIVKVTSGHSLDVYYTPRWGPVPYAVAVVTMLTGVVTLFVVGVLRLIQWYRQRAVTPNNRWRGP